MAGEQHQTREEGEVCVSEVFVDRLEKKSVVLKNSSAERKVYFIHFFEGVYF